jgi:hypothetical protein
MALEKKWLTKDAYLRLATMLIGINAVDCYRLADFHQFIYCIKKNMEKNMTIVSFAGILGSLLIQKAARLSDVESLSLSLVLEDYNLSSVPTNVADSSLSSISEEATLSCAPIRSDMDVNNMIHQFVKLTVMVD